MINDILFSLWDKSNEEMLKKQQLKREEITKFLRPKVKKTSIQLKMNIIIYLFTQLAAIILLALNVIGYMGNTLIVSLDVLFILFTSFVFWYSFKQLRFLIRLDQSQDSLIETIIMRLLFFKKGYHWWIIFTSVTMVILIFAVNTYMDNDNGVYRINKPFLYAGLNVMMLIIFYTLLRISLIPVLRQNQIFLSDLEEGELKGTSNLKAWLKKWRVYLIIGSVILIVVFTYLLILGIQKAQMY